MHVLERSEVRRQLSVCSPIIQVTGEWKGITAGGCPNYPETHRNNPVYFCELEESSSSKTLSVLVKVRGPR